MVLKIRKKRRDFLKSAFALVPVSFMVRKSTDSQIESKKAIILSTWDSGLSVNKVAAATIKNNGPALDAVEKAGIYIENEISCCVGLGGNPDREGKVTLDACIMDHQYNCGSVTFLQKIKHPVSLARRIMEKTPHVMLTGEGALQFAKAEGFEVENGKLSKSAKEAYANWLETSQYQPVINIENMEPKRKNGGSFNHDTMGTICMDKQSHLAGMCTTSGMAFKMHGRVGDSPIIGSGLYVSGDIGAATASGQGEEVIRICGTHSIIELMRIGIHPMEACKKVIERIVNINPEKAKNFQVGFIALSKSGEWGSYSVQPGFSFAVTYADYSSEVLQAESYFS